MAYTDHVLCAFGGKLGTAPDDIWECTLRVSSDGGGSTVDPEVYLGEVAPLLATWFSTAANNIPTIVSLEFLKANHIGADGKYSDPGVSHTHDFSGVTGGVGTISAPAFNTIAITWETAVMRGPAHRGRIYLPNFSIPVLGTAPDHISNAARDAVRDSGKTLLAVFKNAASTTSGASPNPGIYSNIGAAVHQITGVSCDNVYDVQRRRKNRAIPVRSSVVSFP
jgi:hypothetical protein